MTKTWLPWYDDKKKTTPVTLLIQSNRQWWRCQMIVTDNEDNHVKSYRRSFVTLNKNKLVQFYKMIEMLETYHHMLNLHLFLDFPLPSFYASQFLPKNVYQDLSLKRSHRFRFAHDRYCADGWWGPCECSQIFHRVLNPQNQYFLSRVLTTKKICGIYAFFYYKNWNKTLEFSWVHIIMVKRIQLTHTEQINDLLKGGDIKIQSNIPISQSMSFAPFSSRSYCLYLILPSSV